jgi:hypothetical protein
MTNELLARIDEEAKEIATCNNDSKISDFIVKYSMQQLGPTAISSLLKVVDDPILRDQITEIGNNISGIEIEDDEFLADVKFEHVGPSISEIEEVFEDIDEQELQSVTNYDEGE